MNYIDNPAYGKMRRGELKQKYWFHSVLVGNHAEARAYLGGFLREAADGDAHLIKAADCYEEIHDTCWKIWGAAGGGPGKSDQKTCKALRRKKKREAIAALIRKIEALDFAAAAELSIFCAPNE